jgi:hypothetical protein
MASWPTRAFLSQSEPVGTQWSVKAFILMDSRL